jgi:hypothetical protein
MKINKLSIFLLVPLFVAAFSFSPGYSADSAGKPSLMDKVKKAEKAMNSAHPQKKAETPLSESQMATVEKCSGDYEACSEKCIEKDANDICDDKCKEDLLLCEKDLPKDWKTIK